MKNPRVVFNRPKTDSEVLRFDEDSPARMIALKIYHEFRIGQTCVLKGKEFANEVWAHIENLDMLDNKDEYGRRINKKPSKRSNCKVIDAYIGHKIFTMQDSKGGRYTLWRIQ